MKSRELILLSISIVAFVAVLLADPVPQDIEYHHFADTHTLFSIPNFWNVVSNIPFLIAGILGITHLKQLSNHSSGSELLIYFFMFLGFLLTCIGSSYYHWNPNNETLLWDRIPMTLIFMSFFCAICGRVIHHNWYKVGLKVLIPLGVISVVYWFISEIYGAGDLRFYALVQYLPPILLPLILWLYREKITSFKFILLVLLSYFVAKIWESFDFELYATSGFISGHSLKHLFAALACYFMTLDILHLKRDQTWGD